MSEPQLQVFYDASCPICAREIGFYRRRRGARAIQWLDVTRTPSDTLPAGLCREQALARFHVADGAGRLYSGGRAFVELWATLPAFAPLGRIARYKPFTMVLEMAYRAFLRVRPVLQRLVSGPATPQKTDGNLSR